MRYVSDILFEGDHVPYLDIADKCYSVEVTDTETGIRSLVGPADESFKDIIGVSLDHNMIVRYSPVALKFNNYVKCNGSGILEESGYGETDEGYWSGGIVINRFHQRYISLSLQSATGSVLVDNFVVRTMSTVLSKPVGYTLYDFFMMIYKKLKFEGILRYRSIKFYSNTLNYQTVLRLDQTDEARRFYAKMLMCG